MNVSAVVVCFQVSKKINVFLLHGIIAYSYYWVYHMEYQLNHYMNIDMVRNTAKPRQVNLSNTITVAADIQVPNSTKPFPGEVLTDWSLPLFLFYTLRWTIRCILLTFGRRLIWTGLRNVVWYYGHIPMTDVYKDTALLAHWGWDKWPPFSNAFSWMEMY